MVTTILSLVILALVVWFVFWLVDRIPVPNPFNWIIKAVVGLVAALYALQTIGILN